ncbi:hypothetical protein BaRGS_00020123 [Batillaria attramentaria]|uniref:Uncharacterized protein n=1 Tax=Batillaria attramentaria TaxID=370345 RepID=A0ABD0KN45_9CAEN
MLFGSLQKDVAKKKPSTNSSETTKQKEASKKKSTKNTSDSAKTAQKKKTAAKKKHPVDDVTKQRLQDMYMYSVQSSAPGDQVDDLEGNFVATKNMKSEGEPDFLHDVPEDVLVPDNQAEVTVDDSESLEYFPEERTNDVHIPKVLPVPGSTNTASVTSTVSTKKKHSISEASGAGETSRNAVVGQSKSPALENQDSTPPIAAPKEMDFILQCPVLPPDGSEATQGVQECAV